MELRGAVAIITGASSGIGAATARLAHARGARVVLAARRAARLEELALELGDVLAVPTDVTQLDQILRLVDRTLAAYGRIDILVNDAGQGLHVPLEEVRPDDFRAVLELNVVAPLVAMQAVLPAMRRQGGGAIVNVSSATSLRAVPGLGAYAASKAALNMLSQVARAELAHDGVVVSSVYPSVTATEFHQALRAGQLVAGPWSLHPHPPEWVAEAILRAIETGVAEIVVTGPAAAPEL